MKKKRVVVTGMGVIAPNGIGLEAFRLALFSGTTGIASITRFDGSSLRSQVAGEIKGFDPVDYMPIAVARKTDRFAQLGLTAAKLAIEDSKIDITENSFVNAPIVIGSGLGGSNFHEETIIAVVSSGDVRKAAASSVPRITPNAVSAYIALEYKIKGPNQVISTACASGAQAIGEAFHRIRDRGALVAICGGVEAPVSFVNMAMYDAMMVLGTSTTEKPAEASRPFDVTRNGFVMGEGAACLILEELEHAKARGAHIYCEISGFGSNCGAYHMVSPNPTGEDAKDAMELAINDAQIHIDSVDYISAHGTSTKLNDLSETRAIKLLLGKRAYKVPVSGIKSMIGHTIGAAGAIQAVGCCLSIENEILAPTINLLNPDPECDLDYVANVAKKQKINIALSNSFGFGSNNAVLLFNRIEN